MKWLKKILLWVEYAALAGVLVLAAMLLLGKFRYEHLKLFLSCLSLLISVFIFLNCADDRSGKYRKLFNAIGWFAFLSGILSLMMINELIKIDQYWNYLNMFLVLGLFVSQLSILQESKGMNLLKQINFILAVLSFVLLESAIAGFPFMFMVLFPALGLNLITGAVIVLRTGKNKD